jgi:hypothetical protein
MPDGCITLVQKVPSAVSIPGKPAGSDALPLRIQGINPLHCMPCSRSCLTGVIVTLENLMGSGQAVPIPEVCLASSK